MDCRNQCIDNLPRITVTALARCLALYTAMFLWLDRPVALWVHAHWADTSVHGWGRAVSSLASSPAVEIVLAVGFLAGLTGVLAAKGEERVWTSCLFYVCLSCVIAIAVGDGLKIILARSRPVMLFEQGAYGFHFLSTQSALQSTPSGHTLRAFSLMTGLAMLFPRGRWLFFAVAALVGASRIVVGAHYPSDVLFGALVGIFAALWCYRLQRPRG